ncbi:MAG: SRPBCC domain-containing protein [Nitrososphaera sp.]|jgi:uncharacterized protein YndB with AHSA1/START domain
MSRTFVAEQSYYFKSPPGKVFDSLTEPGLLVKWFLSKAKLDKKSGGAYQFDWIGGYHMEGKVKEFEEGKRVTFSRHDKIPSGEMVETSASFQVEKKGSGSILSLRHSGFRDPEHLAECSSRWAYYLTNLKSVLEYGHDLRSEYDW